MIILLLTSFLLLPDQMFRKDYSTVVLDKHEYLIGARLSSDQQWRFKPADSIPGKFKAAILTYEDKHFYSHPGINPISMYKALITNIKSGKIKRGGSTISMQVIRMSRGNRERSYIQKIIEVFLTIGLELKYSKEEIIDLYTNNAPMGGNIVGLDAASWRYFGHSKHELSWAEAATLAVLPNSPSMVHPGRNRNTLLVKRNKLLLELHQLGYMDSTEYQLSLLEQVPEYPVPLPQFATHFVELICQKYPGEVTRTTLDSDLQQIVNTVTTSYSSSMQSRNINNASVIIANPGNNHVLAYFGNFRSDGNQKVKFEYNDMVQTKRSTGSILKPFLYAAMLNDGMILPNSLIRDIPSYFNNYFPENSSGQFSGVVPASQALSRSLNVPAIYMLQEYGVAKFHRLLYKLGINSFTKQSDHYGLSMILGGGEASLFEIAGTYTGMAKTLISYDKNYGQYPKDAYAGLKIRYETNETATEVQNMPLSAASIWFTLEALKEVNRPDSEEGWEFFSTGREIAWKTGTSHGFKDAWAIGVTADYVVGVWTGNASGEGVTGLSGTATSAPILFDIFNNLNGKYSFYPPYDEMVEVEVCRKSGNIASSFCPENDTILVYSKGQYSKACPYHKRIFTDSTRSYRLSHICTSVGNMLPVSWFVLPPVQEHYHMKTNQEYKGLPPYKEGCNPNENNSGFEILYPTRNSVIYMTKDLDSSKKGAVFEIKHHYPEYKVYWHLNNAYIGVTQYNHQLNFTPEDGTHTLTVVDETGESHSVTFRSINKPESK